MQMIQPTFSSDIFQRSVFAKSLIVDMSELSDGGNRPPFGRIYNDSCDLGFAVVKRETGQVSDWYLDETHREDNDVVYWVLKPTLRTINMYRALRDYKIVVLND